MLPCITSKPICVLSLSTRFPALFPLSDSPFSLPVCRLLASNALSPSPASACPVLKPHLAGPRSGRPGNSAAAVFPQPTQAVTSPAASFLAVSAAEKSLRPAISQPNARIRFGIRSAALVGPMRPFQFPVGRAVHAGILGLH